MLFNKEFTKDLFNSDLDLPFLLKILCTMDMINSSKKNISISNKWSSMP